MSYPKGATAKVIDCVQLAKLSSRVECQMKRLVFGLGELVLDLEE